MPYRREIDGLRSIAVLAVIIFHAGFSVFSGGYVGVDVFFVISGYLITNVVISELATGEFSLLRFYERRVRRIVPALFVVISTCLPFAYFVFLPTQLEDFAKSLIAVVFFGSNFFFWHATDYFAAAHSEVPLLHTWSLAVEEQYYLLFPIFLILIWKFGRMTVFWCIAALGIASFLLAEWGWRNAPAANFYLAPTRAWELLTGSVCAFAAVQTKRNANDVFAAAGLALILVPIFVYDTQTPFPSVYTLAPVIGTALIILFGSSESWVARLLSLPILVGIGLISYSAYLWHQPIFTFARLIAYSELSALTMAALSIVTLLLAWLTWYAVEVPFRRRIKPVFPERRGLFIASGVAAAVIVTVGASGVIGKGFDWRIEPLERNIARYYEYPRQSFYREEVCFLRRDQSFDFFSADCEGEGSSIIVGDSHAASLSSYLSAVHGVGQFTASGCPPVLNINIADRPHCADINRYLMELIAQRSPEFVYLHAAWDRYWASPDFQTSLRETIDRILALGSVPVVIGAMPRFDPNLPAVMLRDRIFPVAGVQAPSDTTGLAMINRDIRALLSGSGAKQWNPVEALCSDDGQCLAVVSAQQGDISIGKTALIAWDDGHLTYSGAAAVGEMLLADLRD